MNNRSLIFLILADVLFLAGVADFASTGLAMSSPSLYESNPFLAALSPEVLPMVRLVLFPVLAVFLIGLYYRLVPAIVEELKFSPRWSWRPIMGPVLESGWVLGLGVGIVDWSMCAIQNVSLYLRVAGAS